jgi:hypothetical protein
MHNKHKKPLISLLVPFRGGNASRERIWAWLKLYWAEELPEAEIVMGEDWSRNGYSKTCATNDAASRARGEIFVILDADAYITAEVIRDSARRILHARQHGHRLWHVPYRRFHRINQAATERVLTSSPCNPYRFPDPPDLDDVENNNGSGGYRQAHYYGALIMIMPREAFFAVGGMDPRFHGWSGDDHSMLAALDTLWGHHKTLNHQVLHLHHDSIGTTWRDKTWAGQPLGSKHSQHLATRYSNAMGDHIKMRALVDEGLRVPCKTSWFYKMLYYTHPRNWRKHHGKGKECRTTEGSFDQGVSQVRERTQGLREGRKESGGEE